MPTYGGSPGPDTVVGFSTDDVLWGGGGNDDLRGNAGNDTLFGGAGADTLDGGSGRDSADYLKSNAGVTVRLGQSASGGEATGDALRSIENLKGSHHNDVLEGDNSANHLSGRRGNDNLSGGGGDDTLWGGGGNDVLNGGAGDDTLEGGAGGDDINGGGGTNTVQYMASDAGVSVDLAAGTAGGGHAEGDDLDNIDNVTGSRQDDELTGDSGGNRLVGAPGDDTISGGAGNDTLWGGANDDELDGGAGRDVIKGGAGSDTLTAGTGNDTLDGGGGSDTFVFNGGHNDTNRIENFGGGDQIRILTGGQLPTADEIRNAVNAADEENGDFIYEFGSLTIASNTQLDATDFAARTAPSTSGPVGGSHEGDDGDNTLPGGDGDDSILGRGGNDVLIGGGGDDVLLGGSGGDTLYGFTLQSNDDGDDADTASYEDAARRVIATLNQTGTPPALAQAWEGTPDPGVNTADAGDARHDVFYGIENLRGSNYNDWLQGDAAKNRIEGLAGDDTLNGVEASGSEAADMLLGGDGDDSLIGHTGRITRERHYWSHYGKHGADTLIGEAGADTLIRRRGIVRRIVGGNGRPE